MTLADNVLILGVGLSGVVAARDALGKGAHLTIYAGTENDRTRAAAREFEERGVPVFFDTEDVQGHYDLCVACPGIPQTGSFYQSALAKSDELISEPEYAWRLSPQDWVAVTGTNGKTTTTTLIAHILRSCGTPAELCGNTQSRTTTEAVEHRAEGSAIVAEMSSFQLASTRDFSPRVAVLLNITSDHIAWHGSKEAYAAAKLKIFAKLGPGQTAVIADEVPDSDGLASRLRDRGVRVVRIGSERDADCAFENEDGMLFAKGPDGEAVSLGLAEGLQIKGAHNVVNALAAASAALAMGCPATGVASALVSFAPLAHRIEPAGTCAGVAFYDDSKATNVDATLKALTAFPGHDVVILLGGRDKGTGLSELVETCERTCSAAICYGEAGKRFYGAFEKSPLRHELVGGMRDAFALACDIARDGDVVLLSPACASFDEFSGFAERGDVFKQLVAQRSTQGL